MISERRVRKLTSSSKDAFLHENQESIIASKIQSYFGDLLLLNAPNRTIERLTDSEITFFTMTKNPSLDGLAVVSSYQKILDAFIEHCITANYRKFCKKRNCTMLRTNDPLEKSLHLIVNKGYTLSVGRLYGLLRSIRSGERLYEYGGAFAQYLERYMELRETLLSDAFFSIFERIVRSEVFGEKRHKGSISFEETRMAREWMVGSFDNKQSLLYLLLTSESVAYM